VTQSWATGLDLHVATSRSRRRASLEESLRQAIQARRLAAGARLPSTRTLALDLDVSRGTVAAVYDQLVAEGYLVARQGAGTVVADLGPAQPPARRRRRPPASGMDLRPGTPDVATFPVAAWLRCARTALNRAPSAAYGYGVQQGQEELRGRLADYLGRTRGVLARPERIVITSGTTQAVSLLCGTLGRLGRDRIAMENPCFAFHRRIARWAGQTVLPLPLDGRGAVVDRLGKGRLDDVHTVLVTPAHQYPAGVTMDAERRQALVAWARAGGGLVIEDDYDGEFRYDRQPIGALQGMAPESVVYLGTASKTIGPGLRLGWAVLPEYLVDPVSEAKFHTDHSCDATTQLTLAEFIAGHGYDRHIRALRQRYRRRRDLLVAALDGLLAGPGPPLLTGVSAGLQALVRLPADGPSEADVVAAAQAEGLALEGLGVHWHSGTEHTGKGIVIGFSRPSEHAYPAAVAVLARVLRQTLS
jgi:GntR family transcriptional regulator/MocR family aminotransferase